MNYKTIIAGTVALGLIGFTSIYAGEDACAEEALTHKGTEIKVTNAYQIMDAIYMWKAIHYQNNQTFLYHNEEDHAITQSIEEPKPKTTERNPNSSLGFMLGLIKF